MTESSDPPEEGADPAVPAAETAEPAAETAGLVAETSGPVAPSTEAIQTVARRTWTRGMLVLAASFVLLVALGMAAVMVGDRLRAPEDVIALEQIEGAPDARSATAAATGGGTAAAHWSVSLGTVVLVTEGLDAAAEGETYEAWFVRDGAPVSAGRFDTDETGAATVLLDGSVQEGDVIEVTVEPAGGSSSGEPTADPIVTIPTD